jgi:receptor protein-tyrosine kinase
MSRVHNALRKAAQDNPQGDLLPQDKPPHDRLHQDRPEPPRPPRIPSSGPTFAGLDPYAVASPDAVATQEPDSPIALEDIEAAISAARRMEFHPLVGALLVNPSKPREAPAEEFRTLRTKLNHLQTTQPLHTLVITSPSPAEGKSFTAANLALTQSQLKGKRILLVDFDFRRPTVDKTFQVPISPGMTNYLQGTASLADILMRIGDSNLYVIAAGGPVQNPLELLNLRECSTLLAGLRSHFDWVILNSPPLLFAADGNLLATMADGTVLVVRIGTTTYDSVSRAVQSLCENNVLGIVVNGARRGELYSKYSYYHDYSQPENRSHESRVPVAEAEPVE